MSPSKNTSTDHASMHSSTTTTAMKNLSDTLNNNIINNHNNNEIDNIPNGTCHSHNNNSTREVHKSQPEIAGAADKSENLFLQETDSSRLIEKLRLCTQQMESSSVQQTVVVVKANEKGNDASEEDEESLQEHLHLNGSSHKTVAVPNGQLSPTNQMRNHDKFHIDKEHESVEMNDDEDEDCSNKGKVVMMTRRCSRYEQSVPIYYSEESSTDSDSDATITNEILSNDYEPEVELSQLSPLDVDSTKDAEKVLIITEEEERNVSTKVVEDENELSEWTFGNNISTRDNDDYLDGEEERVDDGNEYCEYEDVEEDEDYFEQLGISTLESIEEVDEDEEVDTAEDIVSSESEEDDEHQDKDQSQVKELNLDSDSAPTTAAVNEKYDKYGLQNVQSWRIDDNNSKEQQQQQQLLERPKEKYGNLVEVDDEDDGCDDDDRSRRDAYPAAAAVVVVGVKAHEQDQDQDLQLNSYSNNHGGNSRSSSFVDGESAMKRENDGESTSRLCKSRNIKEDEDEKANQEQNGREIITLEKANTESSQSTMSFSCPSISTTSTIIQEEHQQRCLSPSVTNETNNSCTDAVQSHSTSSITIACNTFTAAKGDEEADTSANSSPSVKVAGHAPFQTGISTWFHHPENKNQQCTRSISCSESGANTSSKNTLCSSSTSSSSSPSLLSPAESDDSDTFNYSNTFSQNQRQRRPPVGQVVISDRVASCKDNDNKVNSNLDLSVQSQGESSSADSNCETETGKKSTYENDGDGINSDSDSVVVQEKQQEKLGPGPVISDCDASQSHNHNNNNQCSSSTRETPISQISSPNPVNIDSCTQYVTDEIRNPSDTTITVARSVSLVLDSEFCDNDNNNSNHNLSDSQTTTTTPLVAFLQISRQQDEIVEEDCRRLLYHSQSPRDQYSNLLLLPEVKLKAPAPASTTTVQVQVQAQGKGNSSSKRRSPDKDTKEIMHQRGGVGMMANNSSSSSSTTSSTTTLRSVLRRPGFTKQRRGRCVTFNESLNLFYDAECSCWIHEDEYSRMRQDEIERRERESELYQQQYEQQYHQQQQQQQQQQAHLHHQYLQPYEFDDPPTLSPPEGYKDRFFPQEFMTMEPDVTRVSPPSPPAARRKVFLRETSGSIPNNSLTNGQDDEDGREGHGHLQMHQQQQPLQQQPEYETTKKKGSRLGGILKGGRLWRSNSNDGKKLATTPPDEPDIVKCSEASPTQYSQTEPLQQLPLQTQYYEPNPLLLQQQASQLQQPCPVGPTKVDIGTAPLRTSEQIRLAVDSTLRMRSSNKKKPECSSLVEKLRWLTSLDDEEACGDGNQSGFATWPARDKNGISLMSNGAGGSNGSPNSGNSPNNSHNKKSSDAGTSTNEELFIHSSVSMRQPVQEAKIKQISYTLEDIEEGLKGNENELETFITKDGGRIERLRKRYGDENGGNGCADDYGFSRRPSVKGIKPKFSTTTQIFAQFTANANAAAINRKGAATPIPGQDSANAVPMMNNVVVGPSPGILMNQNQIMGQQGGDFHHHIHHHQPPAAGPAPPPSQRVLMNNVVVGMSGECQYENTRLPENNLIVGTNSISNSSAGGLSNNISSNSSSSNHPHVSVLGQLPPSSSSTSTISSSNSNDGGPSSINSSSGNNSNNNNSSSRFNEFQNTPGRQTTDESRAHNFEMIRQSFESASGGSGGGSGNGGSGVAIGAGGNFVNFSRPHSWSVSTLPHTHSSNSGGTNLGHTQSFNTQQHHHHYQQQHNHSNSISGAIVTTAGPPGQQQQSNHIQNNIYGTLQHQHSLTQQQQQPIYGTVRRVPNVIGRPLFLHYNGALSVEAHPNKIVYPNPKSKVPETPSPTQPPTMRYYGPPIRYYNPPPPVPPRTVTAQQQQQQLSNNSLSLTTSSSMNSSTGGIIISAQPGINNLNHPGTHGNHPHVNVLLTMNDVERGVPEGATEEEQNIKEPYPMNV